ncbi:MAG: hypothetical protein R3C68_16420 [Myxococcota bacterium]
MQGAQTGWVSLDQNKQHPRYADPKHIDDLTPSTAVRNLPAVVGMIEGCKEAMGIIRGIALQGLPFVGGKPGIELLKLQYALEASATWTFGLKDPVKQNEAHSRIVAIGSAMTSLALVGKRDEEFYRALPETIAAMKTAVFEAGEAFYLGDKPGQKMAAKVGLKHAPRILTALGFEKPAEQATWKGWMQDITNRMSLEDQGRIAELLGRKPIQQEGEALRAYYADRFKADEWFVSKVTGAKPGEGVAPAETASERIPTRAELAARGKEPLTDQEIRLLAALDSILNATWIKGQPFRGSDRTQSDVREGVYDSYPNLASKSSELDAGYVIGKDSWEAFEKINMADTAVNESW